MKVCVHRGSNEIGGSCIEIESQGKRIILDIGLPLDSDYFDVPLPLVSGFINSDDSLLGVLISHPHLDHYGLASKISTDVTFMIGISARRILEIANLFLPHGVTFKNTIDIKNRSPIHLEPFTLTPFLMDHSAYDAYSVLVEAGGKRLFYSGDFRAHGRKGKLFDQLISNPPQDIDVLLMEGTTIGRSDSDISYPSEDDLEKEFVELMFNCKGMVLVWCSGQNIDRLVTVFRACLKTERQFIVDMYTASILRATHNPKVPQAEWDRVKVYLPKTQKRSIIKKKLFDLSNSFKSSRIFPEQLAGVASKSVMLFRPSIISELEEAKCLNQAALIYSLWPGYLESDRYEWLKNHLKKLNIQVTHCHTSGHSSVKDLKRLANALKPKMLVPVHTLERGHFQDLFKNVVIKDDGQIWEVV